MRKVCDISFFGGAAVERASHTLRDLRVAEVVELDLVIEKGKVSAYRAKVRLSLKYEGHHT